MNDFFANILKLLRKPFPEDESRLGSPRNITAISVFVTLFLYIFQPFGIATIESGKFLICLGFGLSTFVAIVLYDFLVGQLLNLNRAQEHWTFGKWILNNLGAMFFISLANFLFARLVIFGYIQWELFPYMLYSTFMIGIIPVVVLGRMSLLKQEKKYRDIAAAINQQKKVASPVDTRSDELLFDVPIRQIRFVEALQNYVRIGYVDSAGQCQYHTERATLKQILQVTTATPLVQCHRSFLVNRAAIAATSGNAQGLLLQLVDCDKQIPVSRSYVSIFRTS